MNFIGNTYEESCKKHKLKNTFVGTWFKSACAVEAILEFSLKQKHTLSRGPYHIQWTFPQRLLSIGPVVLIKKILMWKVYRIGYQHTNNEDNVQSLSDDNISYDLLAQAI